jgi:hypothetical protein
VVGLVRDLHRAGAYYDELVLLELGPDGNVVRVWPGAPSPLRDRRATMAVVGDGVFRVMWLESENAGLIQYEGTPDDPFGGPTYGAVGPGPARGRPVLPCGDQSVIGTFAGQLLALQDRIVGIYDSVYGAAPNLIGVIGAELRRSGDTYRPWHASFLRSDRIPVFGPGQGENLLVVVSGSGGPDAPGELLFWHAHDLRAMATAAPTTTIRWEHDGRPFVVSATRMATDGSRSLVLVHEEPYLPLTNTYAIVLGCLP